MRAVASTLVSLLLLFSAPLARSVSLEQTVVSGDDIKRARNVRDTTQAPNSLLGGAAESVAKMAAEGARSQEKGCQNGSCDYVMVNFEVVAGFSTEGVDRVFSMTPVERQSGRVEPNASKNGATIFKTGKASVAGNYRWHATWDKGRKSCYGELPVSGQKANLTINVYSDCRSAGVSEF